MTCVGVYINLKVLGRFQIGFDRVKLGLGLPLKAREINRLAHLVHEFFSTRAE